MTQPMWTFWSHENAKDSAVWWLGCLLTQYLNQNSNQSELTYLLMSLEPVLEKSRPISPDHPPSEPSKSCQNHTKGRKRMSSKATFTFPAFIFLKKEIMSSLNFSTINTMDLGRFWDKEAESSLAWPLMSQQAADSLWGNRCWGLKSGGETGHHRRKRGIKSSLSVVNVKRAGSAVKQALSLRRLVCH